MKTRRDANGFPIVTGFLGAGKTMRRIAATLGWRLRAGTLFSSEGEEPALGP